MENTSTYLIEGRDNKHFLVRKVLFRTESKNKQQPRHAGADNTFEKDLIKYKKNDQVSPEC